jgi:DNA-binding FadR family transcriptional regulator
MTMDRRYQLVARQIIELIESGEFPTGSRLPGERELAERLGVSRVTIREAEIALEAQGYLAVKTGSGVYVRPRLPDDLTALTGSTRSS